MLCLWGKAFLDSIGPLLLPFNVESNNGKAMPSSDEGDQTKKQCPCYCTQPKTESKSCRG